MHVFRYNYKNLNLGFDINILCIKIVRKIKEKEIFLRIKETKE